MLQNHEMYSVWNTSALVSNGMLTVVVNAKPVIASVALLNGALGLSGTGGLANGDLFYLLGNFNFTNPVDTNSPQSHYLIRLP